VPRVDGVGRRAAPAFVRFIAGEADFAVPRGEDDLRAPEAEPRAPLADDLRAPDAGVRDADDLRAPDDADLRAPDDAALRAPDDADLRAPDDDLRPPADDAALRPPPDDFFAALFALLLAPLLPALGPALPDCPLASIALRSGDARSDLAYATS